MRYRAYRIEKKEIKIAHISDFHIGSIQFSPDLMERMIDELNSMELDAVVVTGDLTNEGYREEYEQASMYLMSLKCRDVIVVPGNHDSRNVGYVHFGDLFGPRFTSRRIAGVTIVGVDSSQPDLDNGKIGRERYKWIVENFSNDDDFKILALHHHLISVPGTGRERNVVFDAGDLLELLVHCGVDLVLSGHKHVPHVWRLEGMYIINAGTAASLRLRGHSKPCYNLIEIRESAVRILRKTPFEKEERTAEFGTESGESFRTFQGIIQDIIAHEID